MPRRRRVRVRFGARSTVRRPAEPVVPRSTPRGPSAAPDDLAGPPRGPGPLPGHDDDGGAGVREPRRPRPTRPAASAWTEPEPDQYLDLAGRP